MGQWQVWPLNHSLLYGLPHDSSDLAGLERSRQSGTRSTMAHLHCASSGGKSVSWHGGVDARTNERWNFPLLMLWFTHFVDSLIAKNASDASGWLTSTSSAAGPQPRSKPFAQSLVFDLLGLPAFLWEISHFCDPSYNVSVAQTSLKTPLALLMTGPASIASACHGRTIILDSSVWLVPHGQRHRRRRDKASRTGSSTTLPQQ